MTDQNTAIRSFVRREGRMTSNQKKSFEILWSKYGIDYQDQFLDFTKYFEKSAPLILEVGFGMGGSLIKMAEKHPDHYFLGVEVYRPGVGALFSALEKKSITNVRVICADAVDVLKNMIPNNSLDRLLIFFPDPWPKKRHHKRRLIQPSFLKRVLPKLKSKAIVHVATDWKDYAESMLEAFQEFPEFTNFSENSVFVQNIEHRPLTKFEERGRRLGYSVLDLMFQLGVKC